jgi:tRNA pseudouridine55 synthase
LLTVSASGLTIVDKSAGMTSHDVVSQVRRITGTRRVGHGGTLDPMATGVLVLAVGPATRLLTYISGSDKAYQATIRLGMATLTDDAEGEVVASVDASHITETQVRDELTKLAGETEQVPSSVSAVKVAGRRAYARVRAGEKVALKARRVRISQLELLRSTRPAPDLLDCDVVVECSSGTYVRAIARDLGVALGVGGHLTALRRTRVAGFTLDQAVPLETLRRTGQAIAIDTAVAADLLFPRRDVAQPEAERLSHGSPLPAVGISGSYAVFDPDGVAIAVVRETGGLARPEVVLAPAGRG